MMMAFYRQENGGATRKNNGGAIQLSTRSFYMFLSRQVEKNLKSGIASNFSTLPIVVLLFLKAWFKYFFNQHKRSFRPLFLLLLLVILFIVMVTTHDIMSHNIPSIDLESHVKICHLLCHNSTPCSSAMPKTAKRASTKSINPKASCPS